MTSQSDGPILSVIRLQTQREVLFATVMSAAFRTAKPGSKRSCFPVAKRCTVYIYTQLGVDVQKIHKWLNQHLPSVVLKHY